MYQYLTINRNRLNSDSISINCMLNSTINNCSHSCDGNCNHNYNYNGNIPNNPIFNAIGISGMCVANDCFFDTHGLLADSVAQWIDKRIQREVGDEKETEKLKMKMHVMAQPVLKRVLFMNLQVFCLWCWDLFLQ